MLKTVTKTFETLGKLHAAIGTVPASWEAYRAEMIATYDLDGSVLDTFARLGHLQASEAGISFHA